MTHKFRLKTLRKVPNWELSVHDQTTLRNFQAPFILSTNYSKNILSHSIESANNLNCV